jgi:RNA polymerase sigma-54 factor
VARDIGLHESTVSRAISEKTVLLPSGQIIPLSNFFDTSLPPKDVISKLLARSSRPLSDREIVDYLQAEGINLARRTVAKYRQQLAIPPSYHRKRESALTLVHGGQP